MGAPKSLQTLIAAMKLKDAYSLDGQPNKKSHCVICISRLLIFLLAILIPSRESSLLFRLERGPGIALQAMQEPTGRAASQGFSSSYKALNGFAFHFDCRDPVDLVKTRDFLFQGAGGGVVQEE